MADLWEHGRVFSRRPNTAFTARYMYSQPVHAEGRFDNAIERFFAEDLENKWTDIYRQVASKMPITPELWGDLVQFIVSMIVRVPITFDAVIFLLRTLVTENIPDGVRKPPASLVSLHQEKMGHDGSEPPGLRELIASDVLAVEIDPHCCIASMAQIAASTPIFQPNFSFGVPKILHNQTDLQFLSSDNPVCFHGGSPDGARIVPYRVAANNPFTFVFPISSRIALVNSSFLRKRSMHLDVHDRDIVGKINRTVAKFSYRYVFGDNEPLLAVGQKYKDVCPRPIYNESLVSDGIVSRIGYKFGIPEPTVNSWQYDIER